MDLHSVVDLVEPIGSGEHPVSHTLAGELEAQTRQALLLAVERGAFHKLLCHDVSDSGGRSQAVGEGGEGHGSR